MVTPFGRPAYSSSLNLFVEPDPENARRIVAALEAFGFAGLGIAPADFETPGRVLQLGVPPNRIDLMTSIDGVSFEEAWESRVEGAYGEARVPYIGYEALVQNKKASGRAQDLADLEVLRRGR